VLACDFGFILLTNVLNISFCFTFGVSVVALIIVVCIGTLNENKFQSQPKLISTTHIKK